LTIVFKTTRVGLRVAVPGEPVVTTIVTPSDGTEAVFGDGSYETSDPAEIEFLRGHVLFNSPIGFTVEGEEGSALDTGPPSVEVEALELLNANAKVAGRAELSAALEAAIAAAR
jgi:hypothetical protein